MNCYQKNLIIEHSQLVNRIQNLSDYIYGDESSNDNRIEFANKCIQLAAMKKYEEALRSRIENTGIYIDDGEYYERVATVVDDVTPNNCCCGSDFDVDKDKTEQCNKK